MRTAALLITGRHLPSSSKVCLSTARVTLHCLRLSYTVAEWCATADDASQTDQHALWTECLRRHSSTAMVRGIRTTVIDYCALGEDESFALYLKQLATMETPKYSPIHTPHTHNAQPSPPRHYFSQHESQSEGRMCQ